MKNVLVAGGLGVIGRALIEHCEHDTDVNLIGLARRAPDFSTRARFVSVDLLDRQACGACLAELPPITHVVYAAWVPAASRQAEVAPNLQMLTNLMQALAAGGHPLRHVTLLQGAKAYGSHLGPFRTPARETDPRHLPPNFYYDQQDFLAQLQQGQDWHWTVLRPTFVYGYATGTPMNLATVLAVYAVISRELGLPLRFPGSQRCYESLTQAVDAGLVARAALWAGEHPAAANQVFNLTNGDMFRWSGIWPWLAQLFDMPWAEPHPLPLTEVMTAQQPLWERIVARHGLVSTPYQQIVSWPFGESCFNRDYDHLLDPTKIRRSGFDGFEDSTLMFERQVRLLRQRRIIP